MSSPIIHGSPVGPFVFTSSRTSNSVISFSASNSGAITPIGAPSTVQTPSSMGLQIFDTSDQNLYVTNAASNTVSVLKVDSRSGLAAPVGTAVPVGTSPIAIGVRGATGSFDASGEVDRGAVYVLNQGSNSISAFRVIDVAGHLREVAGSPFSTQANPQAMAVLTGGSSPSTINTFVYIANGTLGSISAFKANTDGSLTELSGSPFPVGGNIAVLAPPALGGGFLLASDAASNTLLGFLVQNDGSLAAFSPKPVATGVQPDAIVVIDTSFVYVANKSDNTVSGFKLDLTGRALTPIAGSPFAVGSTPVALGVVGNHLYVANQGSSDISALNIDGGSGALTPVSGSPFHTNTAPSSIQTLFIMNVD